MRSVPGQPSGAGSLGTHTRSLSWQCVQQPAELAQSDAREL